MKELSIENELEIKEKEVNLQTLGIKSNLLIYS